MSHYICTGGCQGESDKAGVCNAESCVRHNQPLTECDCEDGKHYGAFDNDAEEVTVEKSTE